MAKVLNDVKKLSKTSAKDKTLPKTEGLNDNSKAFRVIKITNFDVLRHFALEKLARDTDAQLAIFENNFFCTEGQNLESPLPNGLFSWSYSDFQKRVVLKDLVWLECFQYEISTSCLEAIKEKIDMKELMAYVELIFRALLSENVEKLILKSHIINELKNAAVLLNMLHTMENELKSNEIFIHEISERTVSLDPSVRDKSISMRELDKKIVDGKIWDGLQLRYQVYTFKNREKDAMFKKNQILDKLLKKKNNYEAKMATEKIVSPSTMNILYIEQENYRNRISDMNKLYENEFDSLYSDIMYKKSEIQKMNDMRAYYEEMQQFFREELERTRLKLIAAREADKKWREAFYLRITPELIEKKKKK